MACLKTSLGVYNVKQDSRVNYALSISTTSGRKHQLEPWNFISRHLILFPYVHLMLQSYCFQLYHETNPGVLVASLTVGTKHLSRVTWEK